MVAQVLFWIMAALSLRCFLWGFTRVERLYQFPTLYGAAWLFYMIPQAYGAVNNPDKYPQWVRGDAALELALLMCILCIQAGWMGYQRKAPARGMGPARTLPDYSDAKLFAGGAMLYCLAMYAAYLLASLVGGFVEQFSRGGHYALEWSGLAVRYVFFAQLIYPALAIAWPAFLCRPTSVRAGILVLFSIYPLATTIFLGRRTMTAFLLLIVFVGLYLVRRWTPPRILVIAGVLVMAIFVVMAPQYRTITQYGVDMERLLEVQVETSLADVVSGTEYAEFDGIVGVVATLNRDKTFGIGTGFYNSTVAQLVPRQIVGDEIKSALTIDLWGESSMTTFDLPYGSNPTGIGNAFSELWFFGALIFYFGAMVVRRLWDAATIGGNLAAQIWYLVITPIIPVSVVGSLVILPGQILGLYAFLAPILWYARRRPAAATMVPA